MEEAFDNSQGGEDTKERAYNYEAEHNNFDQNNNNHNDDASHNNGIYDLDPND